MIPAVATPSPIVEVPSQPPLFGAPGAKLRGAFVTALLIFIATNLLLARAFANKQDPDGCVFYLHKFQEVADPEVVFMGSSMCKHVFNAIRAGDFSGKKVASVAYNLQMLSDSYLVSDKFLCGDHVPEQVIIAVGPRDIIDHDQPDPTSTTSFRYLVSLMDLPKYCPLYAHDAKQAGSMVFDKMLFLSDRRRSVQFKVQQFFQHLYGATEQEPKTVEERRQHSLKEYQYRYKNPDPLQYDFQMSMLTRIIRSCRAHHVAVSLVSLPVSPENKNVLGQTWYNKMQVGLAQAARLAGADYFDAATAQPYERADFYDSAHLNQLGARKVIKALESHLQQQQQQHARAEAG